MLAAGVACWRAWREKGGHADLLRRTQPRRIPRWLRRCVGASRMRCRWSGFRAQSMQDAVPEGFGGIAAIVGLGEQSLRDPSVPPTAQGEVARRTANLNTRNRSSSPAIAPPSSAGMALAKARGAKRAHDAADERALALQPDEAGRRAPCATARGRRRALADGAGHPEPSRESVNGPGTIRTALVSKSAPGALGRDVHWLAAQGVTRIVECGPGKVPPRPQQADRRAELKVLRAHRGRPTSTLTRAASRG